MISGGTPTYAPDLRKFFFGVGTAKAIWVLIATISIAFYAASAIAYYQVLLTQPFLGSTVQPGVLDLESVRFGLAKQGLTVEAYSVILVASQAVIAIVSCSLGLLIFLRRPGERVAWVMSLVLVLMGTLIPVQAYALDQLYPAIGFAGFLTNQIGTIVNLALIWIFPNGRFVPAWSRWTFLATCVISFAATLVPDAFFSPAVIPIALFLVLGGLLAQIYRYQRVSGPIERQQTKLVVIALAAAPTVWVASALVLPMVFPSLTQTSENAAPYNLLRLTLGNLATLLIPLAVGLSILRYRLWDVDLIVRRTLVYAVLTALLAVVYFATVVLLQDLLRALTGQTSDLAIVVSTLVIAALFAPLRNGIQHVIDRRLYRRRYDAGMVLSNFGATARDEVKLARLSEELLAVVDDTMQPTSATLWLRRVK